MAFIPPSNIEALPYTTDNLDNLMEKAGIDVLIATSKHNVRYLLGGYQFIFFSAMDAIGHSRYLPILVYLRGDIDKTAYIANKMEGSENANYPFWVPNFYPVSWGSLDSLQQAVAHLKSVGFQTGKIGIEPAFMPSDSYNALTNLLPNTSIVDATGILERLRSVKTPEELKLLKKASEGITEAMQATISASNAGDTKHQIIDRLRREETNRGLMFEYCLLTLGSSHNRAASDQKWQDGEILSIDSGGNLHGYIGDICRMGVLGEPDSELVDLLAQVETVQQAAFANVKAGATGRDFISHAEAVLGQQECAPYTDFFAHGMGLISHEAPFLMTNHPVAYEGTDADNPLETGMVLSIETTMLHPKRGFIKLEDTVTVTDDGYLMFGEEGRGWNTGGV